MCIAFSSVNQFKIKAKENVKLSEVNANRKESIYRRILRFFLHLCITFWFCRNFTRLHEILNILKKVIRFAPVDFCRIHVHLFFFRELFLLHFQFIQLRAKIIRTVNNVLTCLQYHFPKGKLRRLKIILFHKSLQFLKRSRPQRKTKSIKKKFILMGEPKNRSLKSD